MTEEEAKTKWCPFVRFTSPTERAGWDWNRHKSHKGPNGEMLAFCLASKCMAWRWAKATDYDGEVLVSDLDGYCGLAGKP